MTDLTLGQRIAECRKKMNLSQEALGEKVGVSRQAISKWEADGAVPEIDKLITLSKLFGVSVGWLLGIEEELAPTQPQNAEISDELLRKIEEIVLRYQPKKRPMSIWKKVLIVLAAILVLRSGTVIYNSLESIMLAVLDSQSHTIDEQNANIQAQLDSLSSRLDAMTEMQEEQGKLLSDYSFELEPQPDEPMAVASFSAVPKQWNEGDSAYLSFLLPDGSGTQPKCHWNGAFLTASDILLSAENGWSICLTILHADGTQEQQTLYDYTIEHLEDELTLQCEVTPGTAKFDLNGSELKMTVLDSEVYVCRPGIAGGDVYFTTIDYVLYQSSAAGHQEVDRYNLYKHIPITEEGTAYGPEIWCYGEPTFTVPDIQDGDGLELWVRAELSNGMSTVTMAGSWAYNNGEFIAAVPVE